MMVKTVQNRRPTPWSKDDISELKLVKRNLEKKWRRSRSQVDLEKYKEKKE
jgi:hypothetical protein